MQIHYEYVADTFLPSTFPFSEKSRVHIIFATLLYRHLPLAAKLATPDGGKKLYGVGKLAEKWPNHKSQTGERL